MGWKVWAARSAAVAAGVVVWLAAAVVLCEGWRAWEVWMGRIGGLLGLAGIAMGGADAARWAWKRGRKI